jgi:gliding motility-associated-like protein
MTGGTGTYTYVWSANANTGNTGTATGLGAGTYTLTITSGAGCQKDTSFTLAAPSLPNITAFNTINETCLNKNDGSITSATATSTAGLSWGYAPLSNPSAITPIASFPVNNLAPGTYILGIADPLNTSCSDTVILSITPGPLCCNLSVSATITAPTCGNANGGIDVTVTQGSGNYQYTWNGTTQGQDTANIAAGSYAFHLDDLTQGCALDTTFVVNNSNGPQINSVSQSKESCAGLQDGSAWITATGISLNYLWSNGLPNNATQNGLAAGTYFFTVSDINNCSVAGNVTVALGGSLTVNNQLTDPSCLGNDGAINITSVLNGNPPYQYSLNYGGFGSSKNFTSLSSGSYDVVVQDQKGCKDTVTYVLNAAVNNVSATLTAKDPTCIGNDGVVDISNATGGVIPYQYSFNGGAFGASTNFSSLGAGSYTVIVKDNKSCADTLSANLVAANSFTVTTSTIDATCGVKNGEVHFVINGGKSPFQITDGGGANLALDNFGLGGGRIDYTVKDANQCTQSGFVVLTENPFTIKKLRSDTSLCGDATIDLDASNYPCYTHYVWSNGDTTAIITATTSGTYAVTITDDLGNVLYDSVHITLFALPSISLPEDTFIYEGQSIVLNGTVSGGSGVGTYTWTPADLLTCSKCPSPKAVPRDSTTFTVVYTDQAGCEATDFINIAVLNDQSLYIPNAFSPNGDGKNDELKIYARFVKEFSWSVFNRWGEKVFETNDINFGWDGRYKGVLQPPSVYVYYLTVTYLNNKTVHNQGSVTLIR